jgi:hypothetical protein
MRKLFAVLLVAAAMTPLGAGVASAGQPDVECGDPGSHEVAGFNSGGFEIAEARYAGSEGTPSAQNGNPDHAVSQYDIACFGGSGH